VTRSCVFLLTNKVIYLRYKINDIYIDISFSSKGKVCVMDFRPQTPSGTEPLGDQKGPWPLLVLKKKKARVG
jgi:hypothetical protein